MPDFHPATAGFFDVAPIGMAVVAPDGRFLAVNRAYCGFLGYGEEELLATTFEAVTHPDDLTVSRDAARHALAGDAPVLALEKRYIRRDGSIVWGLVGSSLVRGPDGEPLWFVSTVQDVTGHKRAEEAFRASERRSQRRLAELESLYRTAPLGLALMDREFRFVRVNRAIAEINGLAADEHIGRTLRDVVPDVAPTVEPIYRQVFETGEPVLEIEIRGTTPRRPGALRHWLASFVPLKDRDGAVIGVNAIVQETTERTRAELALRDAQERLELALSAAKMGTWDWDVATNCTTASASIGPIFGLAPGQVLSTYDGFLQAVHEEDRERIAEEVRQALAAGSDFASEFRIRWPDRSVHWVSDRGRAYRNEAGEVVRLMGVVTEITERKAEEAERTRLQAQMQHAQKLESLGVLAGGIAHDFNNLLVGVLGNASLALLELPAASPVRAVVQDIERAAQRAAELTRQLLAYAGRGRFVIQPVDLSRVVEEMVVLLQAAVTKQAALRCELAPDLPPVQADATQIRQLVMNLITNASDAIDTGSGVITVRTGLLNASREYLRSAFIDDELPPGPYAFVEVADTGGGMDRATLGRVFEPFFTTKFTGRGLGLAAALGIVRAHRGTIKVDSEPGRGSTFRVLFPVAPGGAPASRAAAPSDGWTGRGTVLVVDDDATVRGVAKSLLERHGLTVRAAHGGAEAVRLLREDRAGIVLVLLDLTMPEMSGEEAFRELRRVRPDVRVVLMSGYAEPEVTARFESGDLAGFVQKPFDAGELARVVRDALGG